MNISVTPKEYMELQKELISLQEKWKQMIDPEITKLKLDREMMAAGVPAVELVDFPIDISQYVQWIEEINATIIRFKPNLETKLAGIRSLLDEETAITWFNEASLVNGDYFTSFAEKNGLETWIPYFLAEMALRPYLQRIAEKVHNEIDRAVLGEGCPVCGEPARLATLEGEGKKVIHCPRCHFHWHAKRLECSDCGNENHETIKFITIEGDAASQIQVCEECNGYTKMIDTRQYITKPTIPLLDLKTIHLDIIALDEGYRSSVKKKVLH